MNIIGFLTLIEREVYRFVRLARQTIAPPLVSTLLFILIFGYSLGSRIKEIAGFPYIEYILPGLIQMAVITNAYANSSTSLFMARLERSVENLLIAPLHYFQIVTAYLVGGMLRGLVVAATSVAASAFFVSFPHANWFWVTAIVLLVSVFFSGLGIISALIAESWDSIGTFTTFVITPFVYLGGVFYSIHMLPPFWQIASHLNPIFYCIDLTRYAFLGISDIPPSTSVLILSILAAATYAVCITLFRVGYKIMK